MSAESALRTTLLADVAVTALVSTRITADRIAEGAVRPFVVFARTGSNPVVALDGTHLRTQVSLEVQCWADTRLEADAVADAVTAAVRGEISQQVVDRSAAFDADLDLAASIVSVQWWE